MLTIKQIIPAQGIVANFTYTADDGSHFSYAAPVVCWAVCYRDDPVTMVEGTNNWGVYVTALLARADSTELLPIDDMPKSYTFQGYSSK